VLHHTGVVTLMACGIDCKSIFLIQLLAHIFVFLLPHKENLWHIKKRSLGLSTERKQSKTSFLWRADNFFGLRMKGDIDQQISHILDTHTIANVV
jgi:hypothetical protein